MNQTIEKTEVQNIVLFKARYKDLVQKLVLMRKESGCSQKLLAEFLEVDKRKIISLESLKKIEFEVLLKYADRFSVDVFLNSQIN